MNNKNTFSGILVNQLSKSKTDGKKEGRQEGRKEGRGRGREKE